MDRETELQLIDELLAIKADKTFFLDEAVALRARWAASRPIEGTTVETVKLPGRTPPLFIEPAPFSAAAAPGDM